ncbi:hypothetical protein ES703_114300 [subsurface metagenome]
MVTILEPNLDFLHIVENKLYLFVNTACYFIKADKERLQKQIDILKRVSELGWQIVYFTAKDEVRDVLKQDIESGKVGYVEVQGIFPQ